LVVQFKKLTFLKYIFYCYVPAFVQQRSILNERLAKETERKGKETKEVHMQVTNTRLK
jgi:hypothetical protein